MACKSVHAIVSSLPIIGPPQQAAAVADAPQEASGAAPANAGAAGGSTGPPAEGQPEKKLVQVGTGMQVVLVKGWSAVWRDTHTRLHGEGEIEQNNKQETG